MCIQTVGRFCRAVPRFKGKNIIANKLLAPFLRGKGYETIVTLKTPVGGRLISGLDDWIPWNVFINGRYEEGCEDYMLDMAKQATVIFDVGANIGYFAIQFGKMLHDTGNVHCFEPMKYQFNVLQRNIEENNLDNIILNKAIVSNEQNAIKRIYFSGIDNTGSSSLEIESSLYEDVRCITIDEYSVQHNIDKIDLMKIDVEGHELKVLLGASRMLEARKIGSLFVEVNNNTLTAGGTSSAEIVSFLDSMGYQPYSIKSGVEKPYVIGDDEDLVLFR